MSAVAAGRAVRSLAVVIAAALTLASCGSTGSGVSATVSIKGDRLEQQTAERAGVEIVASGFVRAADLAIDLELTRHDGDLTNDLASSRVTLDGVTLGQPTWEGDPATGHHRTGTLTFAGTAGSAGPVVLTLSGWPEPVVLRWDRRGAAEPTLPSG